MAVGLLEGPCGPTHALRQSRANDRDTWGKDSREIYRHVIDPLFQVTATPNWKGGFGYPKPYLSCGYINVYDNPPQGTL
jgi:hypothetical protein